jgi:MYXO-CTERM domain-containing protein
MGGTIRSISGCACHVDGRHGSWLPLGLLLLALGRRNREYPASETHRHLASVVGSAPASTCSREPHRSSSSRPREGAYTGTVGDDDDDEHPVWKLVKCIFLVALQKRATAVIIEPSENGLPVSLLIDGELRPEMTAPRPLQGAIVERFRAITTPPPRVGEHDAGYVHLRMGPVRTEAFEVHIMPTPLGDKVIINVLGTVRDLTVT